MSVSVWGGDEELRDRLAVISAVSEEFVGVAQVEHLLVDFVCFIESGRVSREAVVAAFGELIETWPGAPEVIEFTMRELRWPEVKTALELHVVSDADSRTRDMASSVLEVFNEDWPGGEIYRTYRSD